jgi:hypothetical protein
MNRLLLVLVLLSAHGAAYGQTIPEGRWYALTRDRIVGLELTHDYVVTATFDWDLHPTGRLPDSAAVISIVGQHGNTYYLLRKLDDTSGILLNTYRMMVPGRSFIAALNVLNGAFLDTGVIMQYIAADSGAKYGLTFYSQSEIERLRSLPSLKTMSTEDLRRFLERIVALLSEIQGQANGRASSEMLAYAYSKFHDYLADLGYSPLAPLSRLDELIALHKNDPGLKPLIETLKKQ